MILGMGSDLVDIRRIERSLARFGERFEARIFTSHEQSKARACEHRAGLKSVAASYAKRFAAKEACGKALGTGLGEGVSWQDIEVVSLPSGAPSLLLHGGALKRLQQLAPDANIDLFLSMSDEYPYAQAQVIIARRAG